MNENVVATGSISLAEGGDLTLPANARLAANTASGQVSLTINDSVNPVLAGIYPTINIYGVITAATALFTGGPGSDVISVYQIPVGVPLTVNGGGGNDDTLYLQGTNGNDTFDVSANQIVLPGVETVTYSAIQQLTINGLAGVDTFQCHGSFRAVRH